MKTLDEVIELCEKALWCAYLPQDDTTTTAGLALYYLRKYRAMKEHLACLDAVALHGENTQRVNNPALTWDELKAMEGKPVWVEECNGDTKGWLLILRTNYDVINCTTKHGNTFYLYKSSYGEKWQAYRKERS